MILLCAIIIGLIAGLIRAQIGKRSYHPLVLIQWWLVFLAVIPQLFAFSIPATQSHFNSFWARSILISSQLILLLFIWFNRHELLFIIVGSGLMLNLLVIATNGGWMPMSPDILFMLRPDLAGQNIAAGVRVGFGKDFLMNPASTHLWMLSDIFVLPTWFPFRVAFSLGDILIALGIIGLLFAQGGEQKIKEGKNDIQPNLKPNTNKPSRDSFRIIRNE
jgi:hypothetical protein